MPRGVRQTRSSVARLAGARPLQRPGRVSFLYVPKDLVPKGMRYRWVAESVNGQPHITNMQRSIMSREAGGYGWTPVPADRPGHESLLPPRMPGVLPDGGGYIRRGGLILCERPERFVREDEAALRHESNSMMVMNPNALAEAGLSSESSAMPFDEPEMDIVDTRGGKTTRRKYRGRQEISTAPDGEST